MLRDAKLAMEAAKEAGRGRVEIFSPGMLTSATDRLSLDQDLRHAVERDELRLFYQPLVSMESGAIVGSEALVRWQHPTRGLVPPDSFIPLAEEIGMISAIDTWVLRTACSQAATWRRAGHPDLFVAVNVSGRGVGTVRPRGPDRGRALRERPGPGPARDRDHRVHRGGTAGRGSRGAPPAPPGRDRHRHRRLRHRLLEPQQAGHLPGRPAQDRSLIPERHQARNGRGPAGLRRPSPSPTSSA